MQNYSEYQIILASKSPRRRELLSREGIPFEIHPAVSEEVYHETEPQLIVQELARQKAEEVYRKVYADGACFEKDSRPLIVIGADTVVVIDGRILGKPKDPEDAVSMLKTLSGRTHHVFTGCTVIYKQPGRYLRKKIFFEDTRVTFHPMTEEEIRAYVATGEPLDKAGSYGIQGVGGKYIREIAGDYDNVVGLPVRKLKRELEMMLWGRMTAKEELWQKKS